MDDERDTGDPQGLPPRAPAYDLRTGEPLEGPDAGRSTAEPEDGDFSLSELGIWAPSDEAPPAEPGQPPTRTTGPGSDSGAGSASPSHPPTARQPTPPPDYGPGAPYGAGPGSVPGFAPPGPWYPGSPTPPPGYPPAGYPPVGHAPTAPHAPLPPGSSSRRGPLLLAGVVGVLVVVVAVLVAVLALGDSKKTPVAVTSTATPGASTAPSAAPSGATNGGSTATTGGDANGARVAFLRTVDGILTQSASGRQQVSSVVSGVQNSCSVAPADASATIRQVLVNRQSVLAQANALSPPDATSATVKSDLVTALNASIEASQGYQRWLDNLYTTYYNDDPVGCPDGQAPTDANYDAATAASGRATAAKQTFVSVYDPLASAAGLRTWQESEF